MTGPRVAPPIWLVALAITVAGSAVLLPQALVRAQQAVSLQVNTQAYQPPPVASVRYGQTKLLASEQRFVSSQSGLLPSQQRNLRFQSGSLPSQGTIAPPPGNASVRYAGYTQNYNNVANNTASTSVRYANNFNASRSYATNPAVNTIPVANPVATSSAPVPGSTQIADTRITNYQGWTPSSDRSVPVNPTATPNATPSVRYSPASLGQFTPTGAR